MKANAAKPVGRSRTKRIVAALATTASIALVAAACWGCAPQVTSSTDTSSDQSVGDEEILEGYPNFLNNDSGMFPDTYTNTDLLNTGNRGCNSCHPNLFDTMNLKEGYKHILTHTGYDKNLTYKDCEPCHRGHTQLTGPYLGDLIHASHYSNETFVASNGNCWSCHAVNSDGSQGDYQFMLWDDFFDQAAVGGYVWAEQNTSNVREWAESRGFSGGYMTEVTLEAEPQIEATFDQEVTDHEDVFIVNNWGPEVTEKNGEPFDRDAVCSDENTLSITGVNDPKTFTKEELEAMPQTEFTMQLSCATNGSGGSLVSNIPMTGVSMEYLIEQCGGLVDGNNAVNATAADGWTAFVMPLEASTYSKDAYIVTKFYGEDLTPDDGAPMVLVSKGNPGARQVKHVTSVDFTYAEAPFTAPTMAMSDEPSPSYAINGMWFQNDGNTYKVGEPVDLSGAVYTWNRVQGNLETISFSFDMGQSWVDYDVNSEISDFDPYQWVRYSLSWTPTKAGVYQIKMSATDDQGNQMKQPVTLFVTVEE